MLNEKRIDRIDDLLSKIQPDLQVMLVTKPLCYYTFS